MSELDSLLSNIKNSNLDGDIKAKNLDKILKFLKESEETIDANLLDEIVLQSISFIKVPQITLSLKSIEISAPLFEQLVLNTRPTKAYLATSIPLLVDRLGDGKDRVREAALKSLIDLWIIVSENVSKAQDFFGKRLTEIGIQHKNWRVREQTLVWCINCSKEATKFPLNKFISSILILAEDTNEAVREKAKILLFDVIPEFNEESRITLQRTLDKVTLRKTLVTQLKKRLLEVSKAKATSPIPEGDEAGTGNEEHVLNFGGVDMTAEMSQTSAMEDSLTSPRAVLDASNLSREDSIRSLVSPTLSDSNSVSSKFPRNIDVKPSHLLDLPAPQKLKPIDVFDSRDLERQLNEILKLFKDKETDLNWDSRDRGLLKFRQLLRGNGPKEFADEITHCVKEFIEPLNRTMLSLRTTLAMSALYLIADLSRFLPDGSLDVYSFLVFPTLLKCSSSSKKLMGDVSRDATVVFLGHSFYHFKILTLIASATTDRSAQLRVFALDYLVVFLNRHATLKPKQFEKKGSQNGLDALHKILNKSLVDANPKARELSRKIFWIHHGIWPNEANDFLKQLDLSTKKQVLNDEAKFSTSGLNKSLTSASFTSTTSLSASAKASTYRQSMSAVPRNSLLPKRTNSEKTYDSSSRNGGESILASRRIQASSASNDTLNSRSKPSTATSNTVSRTSTRPSSRLSSLGAPKSVSLNKTTLSTPAARKPRPASVMGGPISIKDRSVSTPAKQGLPGHPIKPLMPRSTISTLPPRSPSAIPFSSRLKNDFAYYSPPKDLNTGALATENSGSRIPQPPCRDLNGELEEVVKRPMSVLSNLRSSYTNQPNSVNRSNSPRPSNSLPKARPTSSLVTSSRTSLTSSSANSAGTHRSEVPTLLLPNSDLKSTATSGVDLTKPVNGKMSSLKNSKLFLNSSFVVNGNSSIRSTSSTIATQDNLSDDDVSYSNANDFNFDNFKRKPRNGGLHLDDLFSQGNPPPDPIPKPKSDLDDESFKELVQIAELDSTVNGDDEDLDSKPSTLSRSSTLTAAAPKDRAQTLLKLIHKLKKGTLKTSVDFRKLDRLSKENPYTPEAEPVVRWMWDHSYGLLLAALDTYLNQPNLDGDLKISTVRIFESLIRNQTPQSDRHASVLLNLLVDCCRGKRDHKDVYAIVEDALTTFAQCIDLDRCLHLSVQFLQKWFMVGVGAITEVEDATTPLSLGFLVLSKTIPRLKPEPEAAPVPNRAKPSPLGLERLLDLQPDLSPLVTSGFNHFDAEVRHHVLEVVLAVKRLLPSTHDLTQFFPKLTPAQLNLVNLYLESW